MTAERRAILDGQGREVGWIVAGEPPAPPTTTPRMTHLAFQRRFDFFAEFRPIHEARKTDADIDAAFALFYSSQEVDVEDPMTLTLIGLLAMKGYLTNDRLVELLEPLPRDEKGALP